MESKAAVLGSTDFVMAFSALGLDVFAVEADRAEIVAAAQQIIDKRYGLVVVAENVAAAAEEVFEAKSKQAVPCVVAVPFMTESTGFATESLGTALRMATGIDILGNN